MMSLKKMLLILFLILTIAPVKSQTKIGVFDNHLDIGEPKNKGFAYYQEEDQTYTIGGSGKNMWFNEDQFQYLWTTIQGDFILRAEIDFMGEGVDPHRKVGWIVKNDLNRETPHVNASTHGDGLTSLQYRKTIGGDTEEIVSKNTAPDVIQLERRGDVFIMSTAKFGEQFVEVQLEDMPIANQVFIGLYVSSHNPDIVEVAKFRNVRIIKPAAVDFQPYRDYLGSRLEVMDVSTGLRKILFTTTNSIQAPNWTPDGKKLIYNSEGRMFQYHLIEGIISPLNTGFAIKNNNDHVLSFDGTLMGLSSHNPADMNNSTLYYLPSEGDSIPIVVNKPGLGASYLHGWSPNNKEMLFTGQRNGQYDIYSIDIKTGVEKQLTNLKTLDDGPEYSPDGKHIFFNSVRSGKMKLWKMDPDGKNQAQLTFDEYNDWFPHISPDGKWIAFISFPKDIEPSDHPFYKHCLVRIMPFEGGTPRIIGYIYGGQGSINVPSWSPDSKSISFVTNSKL
jgi:TolB protein